MCNGDGPWTSKLAEGKKQTGGKNTERIALEDVAQKQLKLQSLFKQMKKIKDGFKS